MIINLTCYTLVRRDLPFLLKSANKSTSAKIKRFRHIKISRETLCLLLKMWGLPNKIIKDLKLSIDFRSIQGFWGIYNGLSGKDGSHSITLNSTLLKQRNSKKLNSVLLHEIRHMFFNLKEEPRYLNSHGFYGRYDLNSVRDNGEYLSKYNAEEADCQKVGKTYLYHLVQIV